MKNSRNLGMVLQPSPVISKDMIFLLTPSESPVPLLPELVVELTQLLQEADVGLDLPLLSASGMESN